MSLFGNNVICVYDPVSWRKYKTPTTITVEITERLNDELQWRVIGKHVVGQPQEEITLWLQMSDVVASILWELLQARSIFPWRVVQGVKRAISYAESTVSGMKCPMP
ncbi:hypothetical protein TNCV_4136041 [Trichonephila clavipes]|nr:hypothetical protein TNCV_4136041 [Trichonephila clavipes]